jgi:hypothetical protein
VVVEISAHQELEGMRRDVGLRFYVYADDLALVISGMWTAFGPSLPFS